jgi:hypothetical protein
MKRVVQGLIFAGMAASTLTFGAPAVAQQEQVSPYVQQVASRLEGVTQRMAQSGYGSPELVGFNAINNRTAETLAYASQDGGDVIFVGVCDDDCTDLDLRVRNAQGGVVAKMCWPTTFPPCRRPRAGARSASKSSWRRARKIRACTGWRCIAASRREACEGGRLAALSFFLSGR